MTRAPPFADPLPIDAVLPEVSAALETGTAAVLVAPPGAGKTTRVPLALLDAPWRGDGRIIVLEPRRLAARGAAARMAQTIGEPLGGLVGMRARLASKVSAATRIEVVTEGVFTRMILDDPGLEGIAAVIFDEFHERSLDADAGLAFVLDAKAGLREDLRLLVMSATLDGARVADLIGSKDKPAPVIASEGRAFPVETRYLGRAPDTRIEASMCDAIVRALRAEPGSILAFLPGQGEIRRTLQRLEERLGQAPSVNGADIILAPLYGAMTPADQDRAVQRAAPGHRKVVLATSIAETSLTIEGVRVVIDSGLARVPRFEPGAGLTRLETVRASKAATDQRRGRAGRIESGVCYRLWDEAQTQALTPFAEPEIMAADLAPLLLDCAEWGITDPARLSWLNPPPRAVVDAARAELRELEAIDDDGRLTAIGRNLRRLPLPPRLARMVLGAAGMGLAGAAADIAAVIVERGLGGNDTDIATRLERFRADRGRRASDMRRLAKGWADAAMTTARSDGSAKRSARDDASPAALLALAYPDRIAKARSQNRAQNRGEAGQFVLAGGRGGFLDPADRLSAAPYLVVADMQGSAQSTRILLAAETSEDEVAAFAAHRIERTQSLGFDPALGAVTARRTRRLGAIVLSSEAIPVGDVNEAANLLASGIAARGMDRLPWSKAQQQLRARLAFLRRAEGDNADSTWPDLSDTALGATASVWLAPFLAGKTRVSEVSAADLAAALDALLPWGVRTRLEAEAPSHFTAPTGNSFPIDYDGEHAPAIHIRVQELFGLAAHPAIAGGRLPLTLFLLSPAHRPIQITRDLAGFWKGSWAGVRSEMKGRYPKHVWPDDPASATPTARAKPRA